MAAQRETEPISAERRSWLGAISGLIVAGISAVMAVTIGRFAIAPAFSAAAAQGWTELGTLAEIPEGKLVKRRLTVAQIAGWERVEVPRSVWIIRRGEQVKVFSAVCPHLGCAVGARSEGFGCACHGSQWDSEGNKTAGPTPRSLDELEHRVEDGALKVRYQDFRQGIAAKEAVS